MKINLRYTPEYPQKLENDKQQFKNILTEYSGGNDIQAFAARQFQSLSEHHEFQGADKQKIEEAVSEILKCREAAAKELQNPDRFNQEFQAYSNGLLYAVHSSLREMKIPESKCETIRPSEFEIRFWFDYKVVGLNEPTSSAQIDKIMEGAPTLSISLPVYTKSNDPDLVERIRTIAQEEFEHWFDLMPLPATLVMDSRLTVSPSYENRDLILGDGSMSYSFPARQVGRYGSS